MADIKETAGGEDKPEEEEGGNGESPAVQEEPKPSEEIQEMIEEEQATWSTHNVRRDIHYEEYQRLKGLQVQKEKMLHEILMEDLNIDVETAQAE